MNVKRVALAVALGVSAFGVGTLSDGMLGAARSPTPSATFVIMGAYLAVCQFLVAAKGVGLRANLATLLGMTAPWFLGFVANVVLENRDTLLSQGIPMLLAGSLGPLAGAIVAGASEAKPTGG
jgi:hypothetical protein